MTVVGIAFQVVKRKPKQETEGDLQMEKGADRVGWKSIKGIAKGLSMQLGAIFLLLLTVIFSGLFGITARALLWIASLGLFVGGLVMIYFAFVDEENRRKQECLSEKEEK